jgi:uncharacterized protein GlcG (DUF336 family)
LSSKRNTCHHALLKVVNAGGKPVSLKKISDAVTGHAPANIARSYGAPMVGDIAEALKKFPHYQIAPSKGA